MEKVIARQQEAGAKIPLWLMAIGTMIFGAGALYILIQNPATLPLAAVAGGLAIIARIGYSKMRSVTRVTDEASSAVANVGTVIAAVAVAPLIAFALLWTALLLIIGAAWVLHLLGLA